MPKGKKLGQRVTVEIGSTKVGNKTVKIYSYMLKSVADRFGFKEATNPGATIKRGSKSIKIVVRGSRSNSIKIPVGEAKAGDKKGTQYVSMPTGIASITQVKAFLKKATKNKPKTFVSKDGRTHSVGGTTAAAS